jgi:hypothetical protein
VQVNTQQVPTGIAEQEGLIDSNAKVSKYIGTSWTSETVLKKT